MVGLEPPIPENVVDSLEGQQRDSIIPKETSKRLRKWRRPVGLMLVGVVVLGWTASDFLASAVLRDDTYDKAFALTYVNTFFFIFPLIPMLFNKATRHPEEIRQWRDDFRAWMRGRFSRGVQNERRTDSSPGLVRRDSGSGSQERLLGDHMLSAEGTPSKDNNSHLDTTSPLTLTETTRLSFEFCFLWFLANFFIAECLEYTTVASFTILSCTSSFFTLVFGAFFGVEKFTVRKLIGIFASMGGIVLISSVDISGKSADKDHRGDFPEKTFKELAIGDALAFGSAIIYGLYSVLMKRRIASEEQVNMPLFFGLVGLINSVLLWPFFFIFHWTGIETFQLPSKGVTLILVLNAIASCAADFAWAYAVLLTSPIIVTVGLSLTIPLSLIGQILLDSQTASLLYWIGAIVVLLSFVFVNNEEKKDDEMATHRVDNSASVNRDPVGRPHHS